jgi:RNA polymerase sigma factor (sigma-70 family)
LRDNLQAVLSDEQLMTAYQAGDKAAFDEIFRRYAQLLTRLLRRFTLTQDEISDLVQQTFLQLHRARMDFLPSSELRPWLLTIAFNLARDKLRSDRRKPESPIDSTLEATLPGAADGFRRYEMRRDLGLALAELPTEQQEVVRLHYEEELTFEEIGERIGVNAGAIRVRAHRGYANLRKWFTNKDEFREESADRRAR